MYIDPSSGGMLFQALLAVFGLLSGVIFLFSGRIKMGIARLRRRMRQETGEPDGVNKDLESE